MLNEVTGGSDSTLLFLLKGLEGESEGCNGNGVYGVAGVANTLPCIRLPLDDAHGAFAAAADVEAMGVWGTAKLSRLMRFVGETVLEGLCSLSAMSRDRLGAI